ncbi:MAG TPA: biotin/lipoyl-containing protein, partial [Burkholderiaceae bacterium]|nr:biotin/lipoyl-containing protein [Burkholderiaceae bacterium]
QAGLVFIGPPPAAIRAMGSKSEAKALMERARVPLVPGYHGSEQDAEFLRGQAEVIGYPVLIKASAGGGGKGMRVVAAGHEFADALAGCKREAKAAFGDDRVLIEKYLQRPRHIEIQIFADSRGHCVSLFERDCSVQRRHQKVLEEAPAPGLTPERRRAMGEAAVAAAKAVGYQGAGTVEFIVDETPLPRGPDVHTTPVPGDAAFRFYFMEMNTRLQVEHPVTEMITGQDLVEWQLRVACGEPLPLAQEQLAIRGHAIEARIYAENPDKGFLPSTGTLRHLALPAAVEFRRNARDDAGEPAAVRIDSGVRAGDAITPYYDPMIAKLIAWGQTRDQALARLRSALSDFHVVGPANNVDFLTRLAGCASFMRAHLDTGLIERERDNLFAPEARLADETLAAAVARILADETRSVANAGTWTDPWAQTHGWRLNTVYRRGVVFKSERGTHPIEVAYERSAQEKQPRAYTFVHEQQSLPLVIAAIDGSRLFLRLGDRAFAADVVRDGDDLHVFARGRHRALTLVDIIAHAGEGERASGGLTAPMPGKVIAVHVEGGTRVAKGTALLVMEAMKMEHTIVAPSDGVVDAVLFAPGEQVAEGAPLVTFSTL